ncbi:MAG: phosphohydrolase [Alphaproteobacteria bacterium]|nr:phosphohydrolase [Alphaproteobacteria bacterium]
MSTKIAADARSPLLEPGWRYVERPTLDAFTAADWSILAAQRGPFYAAEQARQALRLLEASRDDPSFGYEVNNYRHSLQTATAALQDGRDEEYVVMALLHDVGFITCPTSHGAFAADLLAPYVSGFTRWALERHMFFQAVHCRTCPDADPDVRERWRGHAYFEATAEFVARYDVCTIRVGMPEAPLSVFEPMVRRVFARTPRVELPP